MKYRQLITKTLEDHPPFRERHRRVKGFVTLLKQEYVGLRDINPEYLAEVLNRHTRMDRMWRKVLEEREDLRGKDYDSKERVEQEAEIALGYDALHKRDIKKLETLK